MTTAFVDSKRTLEMKMIALQSGLRLTSEFNDKDLFQLQHHHLLDCLEKTTVNCLNFLSELVILFYLLSCCQVPTACAACILNSRKIRKIRTPVRFNSILKCLHVQKSNFLTITAAVKLANRLKYLDSLDVTWW